MNSNIFFWVTISSLLFTMLLLFRKEAARDFVSMSIVTVLYSTGTFGYIYNHIFFIPENALSHDALYLLIIMTIIMGSQIIPELLLRLIDGAFNIKDLALYIGEVILSWTGIYIIVYLYILLWDYSSPIVCSLIIPCGIFISAVSRVIAVKDVNYNADDYLTISFVYSIVIFCGLYWFNTLIGRPEIIKAFGIYSLYHSTGASLIPAIMLCLPFIIVISRLRFSKLLKKIERIPE